MIFYLNIISFKIIHKTNTTNDYIIKPLVFTTDLKLNLSSIQINNQITSVLTANNRVYYEYNDAIKFVILKTTFTKNDLRNTYYDRTTKKFYLGEPIKIIILNYYLIIIKFQVVIIVQIIYLI